MNLLFIFLSFACVSSRTGVSNLRPARFRHVARGHISNVCTTTTTTTTTTNNNNNNNNNN